MTVAHLGAIFAFLWVASNASDAAFHADELGMWDRRPARAFAYTLLVAVFGRSHR